MQALTFGQRRFHREFTALKDVSFDIKRGETVGIIGRNGSGKSTLLQLICGILKPDKGTVAVNGRISALLELGAGFNPEFTGRENVYFQGAILGISELEIRLRFDDIADFAGIGEFIDRPVRTYSSGMFVRLAFSVAIHVDPDILVIDEALAVGDVKFQAKCFQRIKSIQREGGAIVLVTHSLEQVGHICDRVIVIDRGKLIAIGGVSETLSRFVSGDLERPNPAPAVFHSNDPFASHPLFNVRENRWGDRAASIRNIQLKQNGTFDPLTFCAGLEVEVTLFIEFHGAVQNPIYGLTIKSQSGEVILSTNSIQSSAVIANRNPVVGETVCTSFRFHPFLDAGTYKISVGVASDIDGAIVAHDRRYDSLTFDIAHPLNSTGEIAMHPSFCILDASTRE
ncbi:MAG TPA: ABC transporter ATP-binding protein [Rhodoferax sp.]|nr:ABC transporter ATP-binding protein [Rhodoferax sp.]HNV58840.1 ABC transporter ATP-binding protein [Rhodoferax sp.]HPW28887.1 ABC transporter ATP-binding protein [Rhodoferax sp.]